MLDEDARNVRRLQELFFEDGDLYTEGGPRERNYRWKNIDGFDWNSVYKSEDVANGDVLDVSDRAKLRFEKQQFLIKAQQVCFTLAFVGISKFIFFLGWKTGRDRGIGSG